MQQETSNLSHQGILSKIISRMLIRNFGSHWADIFKWIKEKKKFYKNFQIWQNCPLKVNEKGRHSQEEKS